MPKTHAHAASERAAIVQKYKRRLRRERESLCCEACAWIPPAAHWEVLNVHHVVPVSCGGSHEESNLVLLCPNCHAIGHALFPHLRGRYYGPTEKAELFWAILHPTEHERKGQGEVTNLLAALLQEPDR